LERDHHSRPVILNECEECPGEAGPDPTCNLMDALRDLEIDCHRHREGGQTKNLASGSLLRFWFDFVDLTACSGLPGYSASIWKLGSLLGFGEKAAKMARFRE
jgi:hypothetical protein